MLFLILPSFFNFSFFLLSLLYNTYGHFSVKDFSATIWTFFFCHQGHGQLSTDTIMLALNKTQVSDLGTLGRFVYGKLRVAFALGDKSTHILS